VISVVLTRRELVNSRETVYTGGNEINMLDSKPESGCDHESAKGSDPCHSVAAICEKTGLSYVNASRVIKRLSDLGFLGVSWFFGSAKGSSPCLSIEGRAAFICRA
jgi:hypothetical protein